MALISKSEIATVLGIDNADIPDATYTWSTKQMLAILGAYADDTSKTFRRMVNPSTVYLKLPHRNIKTIDTIVIAGNSVDITMDSNVVVNEDTGLLWYSGGFNDKVVVTLTINGYTPTDLHDSMVTLYLVQWLALTQPGLLSGSIKRIAIGSYSKTFATASKDLESFLDELYMEIKYLKNQILGDDGSIKMGVIT